MPSATLSRASSQVASRNTCLPRSSTRINGSEAHGAGSFLGYLFETVSAFGTVGLSMGETPYLGIWGKSWIILMMIIGRVGILTLSYIIVGTGPTNGVERSEENLMIG